MGWHSGYLTDMAEKSEAAFEVQAHSERRCWSSALGWLLGARSTHIQSYQHCVRSEPALLCHVMAQLPGVLGVAG